MKWTVICLMIACMAIPQNGSAESMPIWSIETVDGRALTQICEEPFVGDSYIASDNTLYEIVAITGNVAIAESKGAVQLPNVDWLNTDNAVPVAALTKRIALYCTHSDESYAPSDGYYTTTERGSIYEVAQTLANRLMDKGVEVTVSNQLHHPHDAGAYRRSRQTAIELMKTGIPDCIIDIHRDGIPNPESYETTIGGEAVSKIRLLVGRGNQNAEVNKEFALLIKAIADRVYPGLIKDIYLGKGIYNQDLLPQSILFECGTYTLEKERVLRSMPMMADVLKRALYGGILGSVGNRVSDVSNRPQASGSIVEGAPDAPVASPEATWSGLGFLGMLLLFGVLLIAVLSAGSFKGGARKAARNLHEMTGGLIGQKPADGERPEKS